MNTANEKISSKIWEESREKYGVVFLLAFAVCAVIMLIFSIPQGGLFTFYGDYNYQQIPFYFHVHEAVREGRFMWDFSTDLGSDIMQSYTFYLLGSPFFWLTVPFPDSVIPYLMPWLLCLKTAAAALTSYAYIRRFSANTNACCIGAMLYAFSGFQLYNIMFNHFHDATAFFPLLLLASDKLAQENKRGLFAASVALCAVTNYFFFAGMAVFTVIYFAVNIITGRYKFTFKGFAVYAFEALLGVITAAVILLPSAAAVLGDSRAASSIATEGLLAYINDPTIYIHVLKSMFVIPDLPLHGAIPMSEDMDCASASAYLPFVSISGVIGYFFLHKKRDMPKLMLIISSVCMLIPVLNSMFYMFNRQYYARWFFMPVLIMCVMTAVTVTEDAAMLKKGILPCICIPALYLAGCMIYNAVSGGADTAYIALQTLIPIGCMALLYSMLNDKSLSDNSKRIMGILKRVSVCCGLLMLLIIGFGKMTISTTDDYIKSCLKSRSEIDSEIINAQQDPEQYFRVDMCEQYQNRNLMWDLSSNSSFISIVSPSVREFYAGFGFPRLVNSSTPANYDSIRALLSVKYYFDMPLYDDKVMRTPPEKLSNAIESFDYKGITGNMLVYENNCYIPMGFTYDHYTTASEAASLDNRYFQSQLLLEALVLNDEQIARHGDILTAYNIADSRYDYSRMKEISKKKAAEACDYFHTDSKGFDAQITLENEKLVFFSIPYDKSWSAEINGTAAEIEKVSYGFMAIRCPAGTSQIRFDYVSRPTLYGAYISLAGIVIMAVYVLICKKTASRADKNSGIA